jgi:hypothetical protein
MSNRKKKVKGKKAKEPLLFDRKGFRAIASAGYGKNQRPLFHK